jgi:hypothetical protein
LLISGQCRRRNHQTTHHQNRCTHGHLPYLVCLSVSFDRVISDAPDGWYKAGTVPGLKGAANHRGIKRIRAKKPAGGLLRILCHATSEQVCRDSHA